jgi:membrane-associated phospholipid phosphatase
LLPELLGSEYRIIEYSRFEHKLIGFGLAPFLIKRFTDDTSLGSFPSGHLCETVVVGLLCLYVNKDLARITLVASGGIAIATQVLRYHYFVDLLGGTPVVILSLLFACAVTPSRWNHQIDIAKSSALMLDIKSLASPGELQIGDREHVVDLEGIGLPSGSQHELEDMPIRATA